jgi:hypothetical protein
MGPLSRRYSESAFSTNSLSEYWETHELSANETSAAPDSPLDSPLSLRMRAHSDRPDTLQRNRAISDAMVLETSRPALTPFHPASSLPDFLDAFGPLLFPLYRAALLRRRVLFMAEAPVQVPCNYGMYETYSLYIDLLNVLQCTIYRCWLHCLTLSSRYFLRIGYYPCGLALSSMLASMIFRIFRPSSGALRIPSTIVPGLHAAQIVF